MKMDLMKTAIIVLILAGAGLIITAFIGAPVQLQIGSGLAGLGFLCLGLIQLQRNQATKKEAENHRQIIEKLEKIEQELEKQEPPRSSGVVIADVLSSGLKYYADHLNKSKEKKNDD